MMDTLHVYTETGDPIVDAGMDHGLGLHDVLAAQTRDAIRARLDAARAVRRDADLRIVGDLLRRLEMIRRLLESYDRDVRVGVQYRFSAADHLCAMCDRAQARSQGTMREPAVVSSGGPSTIRGVPPASPHATAGPSPIPSVPQDAGDVGDPGEPGTPPSGPPVAPPGGPSPPTPVLGGWYKIGQCNPATGLRIAYCRHMESGQTVSPPDQILAGPFATLSDCEGWPVPAAWCPPPGPPPEPPPPGTPTCKWPLTGEPVTLGGSCCRVMGGQPPLWGTCGPGTSECQAWVICGPGDGSWAISWTEPADPPSSAIPPGKGWVRVPWELEIDEYRQWWADWLSACGAVYDPSLLLPPASCKALPPMGPPDPGDPEPPPDDPPVYPPGGPPLVCPPEPAWVGLA